MPLRWTCAVSFSPFLRVWVFSLLGDALVQGEDFAGQDKWLHLMLLFVGRVPIICPIASLYGYRVRDDEVPGQSVIE